MKNNSLIKPTVYGLAIVLAGCAMPKSKSPSYNKLNVLALEKTLNSWEPTDQHSNDYLAGDVVYLKGDAYAVNSDGNIVLSKDKLTALSKTEDTFQPAPITGLSLTDREVGALMSDKDAFFVFMKNPDLSKSGEVAFPILQGSLRENLERFAKFAELDSVIYEVDFDYFIEQNQTIIAPDKNELLFVMLNAFPIEATVEDGAFGEVLRVYEVGSREEKMSFMLKEGSLKDNVARLSELAEWDYEWEFNYDFSVPKTMMIRGSSYEDLMNKLMSINNYPVQTSRD
ncbi:hypothetical protein [Marinomonas sp. 2405UD68-3]|uniref:hypothetical protein n=1 Tax=Marinomonas sp. 2405UD68-3 TaxID=3391835 RepID=UPI0039C9E467